MNDLELLIIYLVRRYKFFPSKTHVPIPVISITLTSYNGNYLRVEKR